MFSVVVPAYNARRTIAETLRSIQAQTVPEFEVIVVDDGSVDDTAEVVGPFLDDPRFRLLRQANAGLVGARNAGLRLARSDFVAFLDADDVWLPPLLERARQAFRDPLVGLFHADALYVDGDGTVQGPVAVDRWRNPGQAWEKIFLRREHVVCPTNVVRRSALPEGGFDERFNRLGAEDRDMWLTILAAGWHHHYEDCVLAYYRRSPASMSSDAEKMLRARLLLVDKHGRDLAERRAALAAVWTSHGDEVRSARPLRALQSYARALGSGADIGGLARRGIVTLRMMLRA